MAEQAQAELVERVRAELAGVGPTREVSMFGGRSFMVNDRMVVCALKGGRLLVRVAADDHDRLLTRAGARQAMMGAERSMGAGWIEVEPAALADDGLHAWMSLALAHHREATHPD